MKVKRMWKGFLMVLALICTMCAFSACNNVNGLFNLTFKLDGETYQTVTTSGSEAVEIPQNPTKAGYEFDGWYWDNGVWNKPFTANSLLDAPISSDMSVYAKFNIIEYNIEYETGNGTHSNPSKYTVEDTITLTNAGKTGYVFNGWYKDTEYAEKIETISNSIGNITLYANYDIETYDINYTNTKGVENLNPINYTVESDDISLLPLSKTGYTFDGWYNGENKVDKIEKGNFGNITLTAKWSPISYSLIYNNIEGATHSNPATYNVDEQPLVLQDAVKNGYEFLGWYDDSAYTNKVTEISSGTAENVELYAKWEIIEYVATFKSGDAVVDTVNFTIETKNIDEPNVPTRNGYTAEWENYTLGLGDITINAVYTVINYNITYHNADNATNNNASLYNIEDKTINLVSANRKGYTFKGWYSDIDLKVSITSIDTSLLKDIDVYAKWEIIEYVATFKNGDTIVDTVKFTVETESIDEPNVPMRNGYIAKWENYTLGLKDITINAVYTIIEYTATFKSGDTVVDTVKFTVETESIVEPSVPSRNGYTAKWENYTLGLRDITINAVYTIINYNITYHNGKEAINNNKATYTVEDENIILINLSKESYMFDGWYTEETFKNKVTVIETLTASNIDLYAKWSAIEYNITYVWDENVGEYKDGESNPATYTIEDSFVFNILKNKKDGYISLGWFTEKNEGTGKKIDGITLGSAGDITVYAHWGLENYTINYRNVEGVTNTNADMYTVESEDFNIVALSKAGYTFDGWYTDENCINVASTTITKGSTGNLTYYAKWSAIEYNITYVLNGGSYSGSANPNMYTINDEFVLESLIANDKYFVGWFSLAEGGTLINKIEKGSIGNLTLYSRYISFESNGGSDVLYNGVSINNNKINKPSNPEKEYYTFKEWYADERLTDKYDFTIPNKNLTLYAKWEATPFDIIYVLDGGNNAKSNVSTYTIEDKVVFADANKEGYTFVGWFTDKDFTSTVVEELPIGTHGEITLYANFSINKYTISFESNGGTSVSAITQNYASTVTAPESPARNGYEFAGWYSDVSFNKKYTFSTIPSKNITLYAKWNLVTYDITYNLNGGSNASSNPKTYNVNSADITLKTASKKGYVFDGWYTDSEYKNEISVITKGSYGDIELFAKWTVIEYTITYVMPTSATNTNDAAYTVETDVAELTKATLKGYTFDGWYADEKYTTSVITIGGGEIGNKTLYAKFTVNTYNVYLDGTEESEYVVSFNLNGADGNASAQTVNETNTLKYPSIPERKGFVFGGWYETAECDGELYDFTAQITKDITLYAKWFELGSVKPINMNGTATVAINGKQESVFLFVPIVSGNVTITTVGSIDTFGILKNINGVILAQDDDTGSDENFQILYNVTAGKPYYIVVRSFGTVNGNVTLSLTGKTAVAAGGFVVTPTKTKLTYDADFALTAPVAREGYTFLGYADIDGKYYTDRTGASIVKWDKDEDSVLYSVWEKAVYTVTFDTSGGSEISPITLAYGARLDINEYVITRSGYSFDCWYLGDDVFEATTMPDHDITLEAAWKKYSVGAIKIDDTKTAISYKDTITAELFGVYAIDTDGKYVDFTITVNNVAVNEYTLTAGETVTVKFVAGNKQKTVSAKVYGEPTLDYTASDYVNVPDGLVASSFSASGTDTFGNATTIRVSIVGEYKAGDIVTVLIESIDMAGNITSATVQNVKAYGKPVVKYDENKTAIKVTDTINADLFSATATDSFGEALAVTVTKYSGTQLAGNTVTVKFTVTDSKGNTTTFTVSGINVYGTPTISNAIKTEFKEDVSDVISPETLGITAKDTFGNALNISLSVKSGERFGGNTMVYTATVTDIAGNIATKDITIKIYGAPTITIGRTDIKVTENPIETSSGLKATAKDSFGNALSVSVALKSGTFASGKEVIYTVTATDKLGNVATVDAPSVKVYGVDDISFKYSKRAADMIKLSSKGEEFFASATDAFGNACDITVQAASGYTLAAGKVISLYLVATDKAGNAVKSDLIENISVYGMPVINMSSAFIYEDTDLDTYITVTDSFGEELAATVTYEGEQKVNGMITFTVYAEDSCGNILQNTFSVSVIQNGLVLTLSNGAYSVTDYTGDETEIVLTDSYNGKPLTSISNSAFKDCTSLTSITISNNITSIEKHAFSGCSKLTEIKYNATKCENLTSYNKVFYSAGCGGTGIKVTIGKNVKKIPAYLFCSDNHFSCKITEVVFEDNSECEIIGNHAFYQCCVLTSITIPNSVTYIHQDAFYGCSLLTSVAIGNSVKAIGEFAFAWCSSLSSITMPDSVKAIGDSAFRCCSSLTSITIPESITWIGDYAFEDCDSLTSVYYTGTIDQWVQISFSNNTSNPICYAEYYAKNLYINNKLVTEANITTATKINDYAFSACNSLVSVTIGENVTSIGSNAFWLCFKLEEVINKSKLTITKGSSDNGYVGEYALNVKTEGESDIVNKDGYLFYTYDSVNYLLGYAGNEASLTLPENYNGQNYEINGDAFRYCSSLAKIMIPNSVTSIGGCAFAYCSSLASITIPNSVTSIGFGAFYHCSALTSIEIPESVTNIGDSAFEGCYKLTEGMGGKSDLVNKNGYLFYTYNSVNYLFGYVGDETSLTLPENYNGQNYKIDDKAFYYCSSLTSIKIPDSVTSIGNFAFRYCSSLTSIKIPNSVTSIGECAFAYCSSLASITIPNSVTSIGSRAFLHCSALTSIAVPDSLTRIEQQTFNGCRSLTNMTIPNDVKFIGSSAFADCISLTSVTIGNNVTYIGSSAFYGCSSLTNVIIPNSVSVIYRAFRGCISLTSVTFENPNNWYVRYYSEKTETELILTDTFENATYIRCTYDDRYWERR